MTKGFQPLSRAELAQLLLKTEQVAATGQYELFKTSAHFDGTDPEGAGAGAEGRGRRLRTPS